MLVSNKPSKSHQICRSSYLSPSWQNNFTQSGFVFPAGLFFVICIDDANTDKHIKHGQWLHHHTTERYIDFFFIYRHFCWFLSLSLFTFSAQLWKLSGVWICFRFSSHRVFFLVIVAPCVPICFYLSLAIQSTLRRLLMWFSTVQIKNKLRASGSVTL